MTEKAECILCAEVSDFIGVGECNH